MQASEKIIKEAVNNDWITSLSFAFFCKARYSNSTIFDFSARKAARKLNLSPSTINNHIRVLEQNGLIQYMNKGKRINITFKKISQKHKCTLDIDKTDTLKNIEHKLRFKLFAEKHRQQLYVINKKSEAKSIELKKFPTKSEVKRLMKFRELSPEKRKINYKVTFTDATVAKMQNVSQKTAQVLKKAWRDLGYIFYQSVKTKVARVGKHLKNAEITGQFLFNGFLWKCEPTEYILLTTSANGNSKTLKEESNLVHRVKTFLKSENLKRKSAL